MIQTEVNMEFPQLHIVQGPRSCIVVYCKATHLLATTSGMSLNQQQ